MKTKIYKRSGRRFVEIPNLVGMYYNNDDTFTEEKRDDSVGKCVIQNGDVCTICALEEVGRSNWYDAKQILSTQTIWRLPEIEELVLAQRKLPELFKKDHWYWSNTECKDKNYAQSSANSSYYWSTVAFNPTKNLSAIVLPFLDVKLDI